MHFEQVDGHHGVRGRNHIIIDFNGPSNQGTVFIGGVKEHTGFFILKMFYGIVK